VFEAFVSPLEGTNSDLHGALRKPNPNRTPGGVS
jgi:hypothetical protein